MMGLREFHFFYLTANVATCRKGMVPRFQLKKQVLDEENAVGKHRAVT